MTQKSDRIVVKFNNKSIDMDAVQSNFERIFDDMEKNVNEIKTLAMRQTFTISKMFEEPGDHVIMNARKHLRVKVVNAYAVLGDSKPFESISYFLGDAVKFMDTEKAGKARSFKIPFLNSFNFHKSIEIKQDSNRKIIYTFTFESIEEEE